MFFLEPKKKKFVSMLYVLEIMVETRYIIILKSSILNNPGENGQMPISKKKKNLAFFPNS